jgi:hypothetical protein
MWRRIVWWTTTNVWKERAVSTFKVRERESSRRVPSAGRSLSEVRGLGTLRITLVPWLAGSRILRNAGKDLADYTAWHPRSWHQWGPRTGAGQSRAENETEQECEKWGRKTRRKEVSRDRSEQVDIAVSFLAHIRETLGSNLGWDTDYSNRIFMLVPPAKLWNSSSVTLRPLSCKSIRSCTGQILTVAMWTTRSEESRQACQVCCQPLLWSEGRNVRCWNTAQRCVACRFPPGGGSAGYRSARGGSSGALVLPSGREVRHRICASGR